MYHKKIEKAISGICGTFGFGITWTNLHLTDDDWRKIVLGGIAAFLGGMLGVFGNRFALKVLEKFNKFKNKKNENSK